MSIILVAAMMMADAPAAAVPAQPAPAQASVAKKQKPPQVCEYIELTGSRSKRRVCHDANGTDDLGAYGVSNSAFGKAKIDSPAVSTGGPGSN